MNVQFPASRKIPDGFFDSTLPIVRVLYETEQPIVFVTETCQGQQMLAYLAGESGRHQIFVVAPATQRSIDVLESGELGLREALTFSWMWLVKVGVDDATVRVWWVLEADLPDDRLPKPGTLLFTEADVEGIAHETELTDELVDDEPSLFFRK